MVDDIEHNISVWDWARGEKGHKVQSSRLQFTHTKMCLYLFVFPQITETKCSSETVVAAEFHPLEGRTIVTVGKGFVNFWSLDQTSLTLSRKTGIFDQRDKPKVRNES